MKPKNVEALHRVGAFLRRGANSRIYGTSGLVKP